MIFKFRLSEKPGFMSINRIFNKTYTKDVYLPQTNFREHNVKFYLYGEVQKYR